MVDVRLADTIHHVSPASPHIRKRYLFVFVTGNPGLIEYYRAFLTQLFGSLNTQDLKAEVAYDVYGASLPGFELSSSATAASKYGELGHAPPYGLEEVITAVEKDIESVIGKTSREGEELGVIISGHSVGSYITLEIVQRHRRRLEEKEKGVSIEGVICLFPTVVDIRLSQSGRLFTRAISILPFFQILIPILASFLMLLMPTPVARRLVPRITGMTGSAGATTVAFLKSPTGVRQALHMAVDEMRTIRTDRWDSEVWGSAHPPRSGIPRPKLFFYFGEKDHWVADETRQAIIEGRGQSLKASEGWRPWMEIDTGGVPHGFCIAHSAPVAEKVMRFIKEVAEVKAQ